MRSLYKTNYIKNIPLKQISLGVAFAAGFLYSSEGFSSNAEMESSVRDLRHDQSNETACENVGVGCSSGTVWGSDQAMVLYGQTESQNASESQNPSDLQNESSNNQRRAPKK